MFVAKSENAAYKSQVITFDALARITGSCNTLFDVANISEFDYNRLKPYVVKVINYLNSPLNTGVPLFFPKISFDCGGYNGYCDFTFVRSSDVFGNISITCMMSDNPARQRKPYTRKPKKDQGETSLRSV
ncbi:MAG: hypothetical protein ACKO9S_06675 [Bacteroidota bacterium]